MARDLLLLSTLLLLLGCAGPTPSGPQAPQAETWPIRGQIVRDADPAHTFHASRTVSYPSVTAALSEPAWTSSDAPQGTLSLWVHMGSATWPAGTKLKAVPGDNDPLHHCLHEKVDAPTVEARFVESVRGSTVFPTEPSAPAAVDGDLTLDAPSSAAAGASGQLDVTFTDTKGKKRHITAPIRWDAPTDTWQRESDQCPKTPPQ